MGSSSKPPNARPEPAPGSLNEIHARHAEYLPHNYDPRNLMFLRFLQACERLQIPVEQWPKGDLLLLPPDPILMQPAAFVPPQMDLLRQQEWSKKADAAWQRHRDSEIHRMKEFASGTMAEQKRSRRAGPKRQIPPQELVCEWAVRHHCRGESWTSIWRSQRAYTVDQIRKGGGAVLKELQFGR